jgi:hypothetical protein
MNKHITIQVILDQGQELATSVHLYGKDFDLGKGFAGYCIVRRSKEQKADYFKGITDASKQEGTPAIFPIESSSLGGI